MRKNHFVLGVVLGMSLAVAAGRVEAKEAKEKQFHASFAGTDTYKDDFRFTDTSGVDYIVAAGNSTLGEYTVQAVEEFQPDGHTCTPPGGGSGGMELVGTEAVYVLSFPERGENLFLHFSPDVTSHACLNLDTFVASVQSTFVVSGGTGRFEGATGTISQTHLFIGLPPPPSRGYIGSFTGTFDGTINFSK
jgi:hypothetical protein